MTLEEMIELFSADGLSEEGGDLRSEEARVDERPASEHAAARRSSSRSSRPVVEARARHGQTGSASHATGISRCSICSRCARARSTTSCARRRRTSRGRSRYDPDAVAKQWKDRRPRPTSSPRRATALAAVEPIGTRAALEESLRGARRAARHRRQGGKLFQPLRVALTGLAVSPGSSTCCAARARSRRCARIEMRPCGTCAASRV